MSESVEIIRRRGAPRKQLPTVLHLKECFTYDREKGELIWNRRPLHHFVSEKGFRTWNARFAGKRAGSYLFRPDGSRRYPQVGIEDPQTGKRAKLYNVHLIIYTMEGITVPDGYEIDHKDKDVWNNRLENLRIGTPRQNVHNTRGAKIKKSGLPKGVFKEGNKFRAQITVNHKSIYIGSFPTPEDALAAYEKRAKEVHGEFFYKNQG